MINRLSTKKVNRILINGVEPTNTIVTKFTSTFQLQQTFCSCPQPVDKVKELPGPCDYCWTHVVCHYDYCSGGEDRRKVGIYDEENKCVILEKLWAL